MHNTITINSVYVGFTEDRVTVTEGSSRSICVAILNLNPRDIKPMQNIYLNLSVSSENTTPGTHDTHGVQ